MNIIIGDTISMNRHAINTPPKPSALCFMKYSIFAWKNPEFKMSGESHNSNPQESRFEATFSP